VCEPPAFSAFGIKIIGWWGMTETITHGIIGEVDQPNTPMSIGRAAPEYAIRIANDDGSATAVGGTCNLLIKGVPGLSLFSQYLHNEKPPAKVLTSTVISSPATASRCWRTASSGSATAPRTC
jgi:crotonobetaine/carnitine-CoA ligase